MTASRTLIYRATLTVVLASVIWVIWILAIAGVIPS